MPTAAKSIEADVARRWTRILELETAARPDDDFFDLGGTSLKALQLVNELEQQLGLTVPLIGFAQRPTFGGLLALLRAPAAAAAPEIVPLQPEGDAPPLFFIHAEQGHVLFARDLALALAPDQPFYGIESRGLDGRRPPLRTIAEMSEHYLEAIKSVQPLGPYRLGGFCMGALLALELAGRLQRAGEEVSHLAIFSTDASWLVVDGFVGHLAHHRRQLGEHASLGAIARYLRHRARFRLQRARAAFARLAARYYAGRGRRLPAQLRYVHIADLNYRALDFQRRAYEGTISYFQGDGDRLRDPRPFWNKHATGGIEIHPVRGALDGVFARPNVPTLAAALRESLARPAEANA